MEQPSSGTFGVIPYTHWSYWPDEASARRCAEELADYVTRVRETKDDDEEWLLLAGRDVAIDLLVERHAEVEAIVTRHGGYYDFGEATYLAGKPVADPMLTGEWGPG
ncbi:ribonuclease E inhibitor RraB [Streptomyces sp. NPDC093589]|uniref:ribonuclease E inhibitor RraB n=1 Tax=Streptomyces sp. NPDC093589 TaxID=3366043 RepID=UPI00381E8A6A